MRERGPRLRAPGAVLLRPAPAPVPPAAPARPGRSRAQWPDQTYAPVPVTCPVSGSGSANPVQGSMHHDTLVAQRRALHAATSEAAIHARSRRGAGGDGGALRAVQHPHGARHGSVGASAARACPARRRVPARRCAPRSRRSGRPSPAGTARPAYTRRDARGDSCRGCGGPPCSSAPPRPPGARRPPARSPPDRPCAARSSAAPTRPARTWPGAAPDRRSRWARSPALPGTLHAADRQRQPPRRDQDRAVDHAVLPAADERVAVGEQHGAIAVIGHDQGVHLRLVEFGDREQPGGERLLRRDIIESPLPHAPQREDRQDLSALAETVPLLDVQASEPLDEGPLLVHRFPLIDTVARRTSTDARSPVLFDRPTAPACFATYSQHNGRTGMPWFPQTLHDRRPIASVSRQRGRACSRKRRRGLHRHVGALTLKL